MSCQIKQIIYGAIFSIVLDWRGDIFQKWATLNFVIFGTIGVGCRHDLCLGRTYPKGKIAMSWLRIDSLSSFT
jgi:hypothetical protein